MNRSCFYWQFISWLKENLVSKFFWTLSDKGLKCLKWGYHTIWELSISFCILVREMCFPLVWKMAKYCHFCSHSKSKDLLSSSSERANILYPDKSPVEPLKWALNKEMAFLSEQMSTSIKLKKPCGKKEAKHIKSIGTVTLIFCVQTQNTWCKIKESWCINYGNGSQLLGGGQ